MQDSQAIVTSCPASRSVLREQSGADDGGIENTVFGLSERKIW